MTDAALLPEGKEDRPPGTGIMAVIRWLLVVAAAAAAAYSIAHWRDGAGEQGLYTCPMHPEVLQHEPGECPICHMALVPVDEHHGEDKPPPPASAPAGLVTVELSPERIQRIGLRTAPVEQGALVPEVRAIGTIAVRESGLSQVTTRFGGWVQSTAVTQTWQRVKKGQLLATIDSPDLIAAQQDLLSALRWAETAAPPSLAPPDAGPAPAAAGHAAAAAGHAAIRSPAAERAGLVADARSRLLLLGFSAADIAAIEQSHTPLRALGIRAPSSGVVSQRAAVVGTYLQAGTPLYEIADLSSVWVQAEVYERDMARVAVGQPARLTLSAYPDAAWQGKVDFLWPVVDPTTRTLRVRMTFANADLRLRPGMFGDVAIQLPPQQGLLVPRDAVIDTGDAQYVYLAQPGGRFEPRRVRVGARVGDRIELLPPLSSDPAATAATPLRAGDRVVSTANFLLDSESRLRAGLGNADAGAR